MKRHKTEVAGVDDSSEPVALRQISFSNNLPSNADATMESSENHNGGPNTPTNNGREQHSNPGFVADEPNGKLSSSDKAMTPTAIMFSPNHPAHRKRHASGGSLSQRSDEVDPTMNPKSDISSVMPYDFEDQVLGATSLCYSRHETVPLKDFSNEVRASMDIEKYLKNMVLLLHLNKSNLDNIIDEILIHLIGKGNPQRFDQARAALFTRDSVHGLSRVVRSTCFSEDDGYGYEQNWLCVMCSVPSLTTRQVAIARLEHPANLGNNSQEIIFLIVVVGPTKEKGTKTELEVARTFGTLFSDVTIRQELMHAKNDDDFKTILKTASHRLASEHCRINLVHGVTEPEKEKYKCGFMRGIRADLRRRIPHYFSDFKDGVADGKSALKSLSCSLFLYFACILPAIAFGVLNHEITDGEINVEKVLISQVLGGLLFAFFGGTPQIVLLTTAPLAIYTQIIYTMSDTYDLDFRDFFACVGLFNCFFLFIYSVFDLSFLMQYSTRSSEEIFAIFISIAFTVDACKEVAKNVDDHYSCDAAANTTNATTPTVAGEGCQPELTLLYIILVLGTLWLGVTIFQFKQTPYLNAAKREVLADYALPISVIVMSVFGVFVFEAIDMGKGFETFDGGVNDLFTIVTFKSLTWPAVCGAAGLGFCLSLLFFMDQNISAALVNAPQHKMQKGTSYHWDLLVVAAVNAVLSVFCFPWVHAALPHSPLHVMALADVEERVDRGHIHQIVVRVRETRLAAILSHILIGLSFLFLQFLTNIPQAVLYGLFLYVAVTGLYGNQMFERITLFFTEQSAYPPNHYICRVPQRTIHLFTGLQLLQLIIVCFVGFFPFSYMKMFFPVLIFTLIPIRQKIIPKLIPQKYLKALDGH